MEQDIKTLAKKSLEDKWGEEEISEISENFSFTYEKFDEKTNESYISIINIKEACSFCYDALEKGNIHTKFHIEDKIDVLSCEYCLIPRFVCANKGSEGLMGMLNRLFTKYFNKKQDIIWIINLIQDCLRQLRNFGRISLHTEQFINTLEVK